jgi:polyisoprenyl-phosphate glycosyltransferase
VRSEKGNPVQASDRELVYQFYRRLERLVEIENSSRYGRLSVAQRALTILNAMPEYDRFIRGIMSWIGLRQVPVRYAREPRAGPRVRL